jgi:leucyl aminopeptidase
MRFEVWSKALVTQPVDCLVVGIFEDDSWSEEAKSLDATLGGRIAKLVHSGDFAGRAGESLLLTDVSGMRATRLLLTGLGNRKAYDRKAWRRAAITAFTALLRTRIKSAAFGLERPADRALDDYYYGRTMAEIAASALYRVNDLKTAKKPKPAALESVLLGPFAKKGIAAARRGFDHGQALDRALKLQRDLGNLPGNICTPTYLAERARELGKTHSSLKVKILDEPAIRAQNMGCLLAVTRGSDEPPRFIVIEYRGSKANQPPVVLVGKGITFDTGGISLKDPAAMDEMKYDMCGAAAVLSTLSFAAAVELPLNVIGLIAAAENMPSGRAIKPGDIVTSASGQTVEILNTDAEGRLVLCDALHYARQFAPSAVIDIATLTGACVVALGAHHTGVMGNDDALAKEIVAAGVRSDDRAWQLPLTEDYAEQLKSNFADMANVGGRDGGAITAAAFLGKYTKGLKWAHLDIAGTAWLSGPRKGSTGRPVSLLTDFLVNRAC